MFKKLLISLFALVLFTACTPTHHTRGNFLEKSQLKKLVLGKPTAKEVLDILGPPSSQELFIGKGWYYMGEKTETTSFLVPKVEKRHFYLLEFNKKDLLMSLKKFDEKGIEIIPDKDKTPTHGRDPSFIGEFINNIGRYENPGSGRRRKG
ncbi:outer membrane protein assembly factor BamE [Alphaproteobacteria bacterium]|nr:outer membrane protein assembly factor BamE [Alphaproteobacteria bacterium]